MRERIKIQNYSIFKIPSSFLTMVVTVLRTRYYYYYYYYYY